MGSMNKLLFLCFIWLLMEDCFVVASAKPTIEDVSSRRNLGNGFASHISEVEHNLDYDHDLFLGEDVADEFLQLTPEESKNRLGKIVDRIDVDHDGSVTVDELKNWIDYTQKRYINDDVMRQWNSINHEQNDLLHWDDYKATVYSFMENSDDFNEDLNYKSMISRDERRWNQSDLDNDGSLSVVEFATFLHPEEAEHMRETVLQETLDDIDKNQDGRISLEEYIGDMYREEKDQPEPSWIATEREQFSQFRDKNGDGFLDNEEVTAWILPDNYNHAEAEAKHLIYEADLNNDKILSKEEILNKYDLFVGSQATDFGDALMRHDEF